MGAGRLLTQAQPLTSERKAQPRPYLQNNINIGISSARYMSNFEHLKGQNDYIWKEIFDWNVYRVEAKDIENKNVLDIGGHYGFFSLLVSSLGAKNIVTVEANPFHYVTLLKNTEGNSTITPICGAVSSRSGKFLAIKSFDRVLSHRDNRKVCTVTVNDLISLFPAHEDIVMKIDVEGGEYDIIFNSPASSFDRVTMIYIEIHGPPVTGRAISDMLIKICSLGFNPIQKVIITGPDECEVYKLVRTISF